MRTVQAAATSVAIVFSGEAPPPRRSIPALVRAALAEAGLPPWEDMETDCFQAGGDTLLLARPGSARRYFFFSDRETLLAGAGGCAGEAGTLYRTRGGFILAVPPGSAGPGLYEFGALLSLRPDWELHAREQGNCVCGENALASLRLGRLTSCL